MVSLAELKRYSAENSVDVATLERDYAIGWLLKGIFVEEQLAKVLVFKGGTALRKAYFKDFRFSQDIDFTLLRSIDASTLEGGISSVCATAYRDSGVEFSLISFAQTRSEMGEEAYEGKVSFVGPRQQRGNPARIKIDLTSYEKVVLLPASLPLIHPYSDNCEVNLLVYRLEEIVAEKLRTILQRAHPRDLYDVWTVLKFYRNKLNDDKLVEVFFQKCEHKGVRLKRWVEFLQSQRIMGLSKHFESSLRRQLGEIPDFEDLRRDLREILDEIFISL